MAERWVESAVAEGALVSTAADYLQKCLSRHAQLWLIRDEDQTVGAGITEIYDTPKGLTCAVPVLAATDFGVLRVLFEELELWARAEGCVRLEGYGRFGWVRALKTSGWRPIAAVIEKDI